ncbi:hypothetical protein ACH5RR_021946 [Cinchona calisaya]|uniref:Aquaporin n=1 Tax=Cinchona calisaya TaxID=153742 RepID=A0ABD2Z898_9GENT
MFGESVGELLGTTVLIAYDHRQRHYLGGISIFSIIGIVLGLLVFILTTPTAKKDYTGAGLNPGKCFGAAVVRAGHLWDGRWIFWAGPALAFAAFYVYTQIIPNDHFNAIQA